MVVANAGRWLTQVDAALAAGGRSSRPAATCKRPSAMSQQLPAAAAVSSPGLDSPAVRFSAASAHFAHSASAVGNAVTCPDPAFERCATTLTPTDPYEGCRVSGSPRGLLFERRGRPHR